MLAAQLCLTLCHPIDCSPPGSSVHGIFQARVLERVVIPFSRESYPLRSPVFQADSLLSEPAEKPKHGQWQAPSSTVSKLRTDGTAPAKRLTSRRPKKGQGFSLSLNPGKCWPYSKRPSGRERILSCQPFLQVRSSSDWMRPTHSGESNLLHFVYWCSCHPETLSQTLSG